MPEFDTVSALAAAWEQRNFKWLKPQSRIAFEQNRRLYIVPMVGDMHIATVTPNVVREVFRDMERRGLAPNTIRQARWVLSVVCTEAIELGLIAWNPTREIRLKRRQVRRKLTLTAAELDRILTRAAATRPDLAACFDACGLAGLRIGEALALQRSDADFTAMTLRITRNVLPNGVVQHLTTKGGDCRAVVMADRLATRLEEHISGLNGSPWLFPSTRKSGPLRYKTALEALHLVARLEGFASFGSHVLRRTYASLLASTGVSPDVIRRQLRHASLRQTEEYIDDLIPLEPQAFAALRTFGSVTR